MPTQSRWLTAYSPAGEVYDRLFVPAVSTPWARDLLQTASLRPGDRVLDVACGTDLVARLAAPLVGADGHVARWDLHETVGQGRPPPTGAGSMWRPRRGVALPYPDMAFDVVLCQQCLPLMPDWLAMLREMRRVLVPGGRLALSVLSKSVAHDVTRQVLREFLGAEAAAVLLGPFALRRIDDICALFAEVDFDMVEVHTRVLPAHFAAVDDFIACQVSQVVDALSQLSEQRRATLLAGLQAALQPYEVAGGLTAPLAAHVMLAHA